MAIGDQFLIPPSAPTGGSTNPLTAFLNNPAAMASLFGQLGQAFTARDPRSWQYQVGGLANNWGSTLQQNAFLSQLLAGNQQTPPKQTATKKPAEPSTTPTPSALGGLDMLSLGNLLRDYQPSNIKL